MMTAKLTANAKVADCHFDCRADRRQ